MSFFVSKQRDKQGFQPIHLDLKLLWEWDRTHRPTAWTVLLEDDIFS
jgi:hypothetical protein